jgi:hypothetical protein
MKLEATRAIQIVSIETSVHLTRILKQMWCFYFYDATCPNNGHDGEMCWRIVIN